MAPDFANWGLIQWRKIPLRHGIEGKPETVLLTKGVLVEITVIPCGRHPAGRIIERFAV